jgi:hypothetical protein
MPTSPSLPTAESMKRRYREGRDGETAVLFKVGCVVGGFRCTADGKGVRRPSLDYMMTPGN